jgi:hypothetical protein
MTKESWFDSRPRQDTSFLQSARQSLQPTQSTILCALGAIILDGKYDQSLKPTTEVKNEYICTSKALHTFTTFTETTFTYLSSVAPGDCSRVVWSMKNNEQFFRYSIVSIVTQCYVTWSVRYSDVTELCDPTSIAPVLNFGWWRLSLSLTFFCFKKANVFFRCTSVIVGALCTF